MQNLWGTYFVGTYIRTTTSAPIKNSITNSNQTKVHQLQQEKWKWPKIKIGKTDAGTPEVHPHIIQEVEKAPKRYIIV